MKTITLLVAANLLVGSLAFATTDERTVAFDRTRGAAIHYNDAEPIVFMERGIEFTAPARILSGGKTIS